MEAAYQAALQQREAGLHGVRMDAGAGNNPLLRVIHHAMRLRILLLEEYFVHARRVGIDAIWSRVQIGLDDGLQRSSLAILNVEVADAPWLVFRSALTHRKHHFLRWL